MLSIGKAAVCHNKQESPGFSRTDWIKYTFDRGIESKENFGPIAQQAVALIEMGIHGSKPTVERVMDPAQDISAEERFRFLVGYVGELNAIVLHPSRQIDELRAGVTEPPGGNEPSTCTTRLMCAPTFNGLAALIRSHPVSRTRRFRQTPVPMRRTGPNEQEECSGSRAC